jgi:predicted transcriptional regulator
LVLQCTPCVTQEIHRISEATFTFRVDDALKKQFAMAAKERDRTGAQLLREFVQQHQDAADHEDWFPRQVQAGLNSANAGRLTPDDQVEERFAARREATRRRLEPSR